jgi:hypothetical protein
MRATSISFRVADDPTVGNESKTLGFFPKMLGIPPPVFEHLSGNLGNLRAKQRRIENHRAFPKMARIHPRIFLAIFVGS